MSSPEALGYSVPARFLKRVFDALMATLIVVLILPTFALLCLIVRMVDGAPVFFRQQRLGRGGALFNLIKLRSMNSGHGASVTARDDPRITRLGQFLRRSKLDELPQLLQVVLGQMTIIGPRPEVPSMARHWDDDARQQLINLKPGLTDPATLAFMEEETLLSKADDAADYYRRVLMPKKIECSLSYFRSPSFLGDLRILGGTLKRLMKGKA